MEYLLTIHRHYFILPHTVPGWGWGWGTSPLLQMTKLRPKRMKDLPGIPQLGGGGVRAVTAHCHTPLSRL